MIRIGNGRPRMYFMDGRWGEPTPYLTTNGYGYVKAQMWADLCTFQAGAQPTVQEQAEISLLRMASPYSNTEQFGKMLEETGFARRLKAVMELAGKPCTLWEFNAHATPDASDDAWVRFVAPLGEVHLVTWSDFDLMVHRAQDVFARAYNAVRGAFA